MEAGRLAVMEQNIERERDQSEVTCFSTPRISFSKAHVHLLYGLQSMSMEVDMKSDTSSLYSMVSTDCGGAKQCVSTGKILPPSDFEAGPPQEA